MKIRRYREKAIVSMFSIILVMAMTACSISTDSESAAESVIVTDSTQKTATLKPETSSTQESDTPKPEMQSVSEAEISQSEVGKMESPKTQETTAPENNGDEYSDAEEIGIGDPIVGIVDQFADDIIAIKDAGDPDLVYYFSTQNAQVVEGDSPIAVGDMVVIAYRGVMGDEEHPGEAVKIVAESMMYQ